MNVAISGYYAGRKWDGHQLSADAILFPSPHTTIADWPTSDRPMLYSFRTFAAEQFTCLPHSKKKSSEWRQSGCHRYYLYWWSNENLNVRGCPQRILFNIN